MELRDDRLHVDERQMDFLILEELACSPAFGRWFLGQTGHTGAGSLELLRLLQSNATYDGETGLLVVHAIATGSRALLIANKVVPPFTQFHSERYRIRGQAGVVAGCWREFATVLAAPRHNLTNIDGDLFDHKLAYETIRQAVAAHGDPARIASKLKLLDRAIAQASPV
jgi:hypothetical protein